MKVRPMVYLLVLSFSGFILFSQFAFAQSPNSLKSDIYSKLKCCSCEDIFEKCSCKEAKEIKAYIDELLKGKVSREDVFYGLARKFSLKVILDEKIRNNIEERLLNGTEGKYSKIIFNPEALNFGIKDKKDGKASRRLKVYNRGNGDLIISNLRVSCDCVAVSLESGKSKSQFFGVAGASAGWQAVIKPGNFSDLEVVLDLNHSSMGKGKQIRNVFVSSNDPLYPQADLRVEIEIKND